MAEKKKRLRTLSIFLLREGVSDVQALRAPDEVESLPVSKSAGGAALFLKRQKHRTPWWVPYLSGHLSATDSLNAVANAFALDIIEPHWNVHEHGD